MIQQIKLWSLCLLFMMNIGLHGQQVTDRFNDSPIALVSYPRSGNTWARYCLEFLTKRPSFMNGAQGVEIDNLPSHWQDDFFHPQYIADNPLGLTYDLGIDLSKCAIIKMHWFNYYKTNSIPLIFLLRDYRECIIRENKYYYPPKEAIDREIEAGKYPFKPQHYFTNLQQFDWYQGPKLLVYYEDLIRKPEATLRQIMEFLECDTTQFRNFVDSVNFHKKQSLKIYQTLGGSDTKGNSMSFHANKLSQEDLIELQIKVQETYPELWDKYLQRYTLNL